MSIRKQPFYRPAYGHGLEAGDFPGTTVTIMLGYRADMPEEGEEDEIKTVLRFPEAFFRYEADYVVVYTEHYGYHTFMKNTVLQVEGQENHS